MKDTGSVLGAGRLVAVVVTHQRLAKLKATLARLLEAPMHRLDAVIVVDNASHDGTADWLAGVNDPRLVTLRLEKNGGGAGGFSAGIRKAVEAFDPDWVLVMDDDARPEPGAIERFHTVPRDGREAWAAAVYYPAGGLCEMNRPTLNPFWHPRNFLGALMNGRRGFHVTDADFETEATRPIDATSFVGLFLSRAAIAAAGYPDASLFIYGDDVLYTLGLRRAGGRIEFDPTLRFEHDCRSATQAGQKVYGPLWRAYYHHRNLIFVYRRAAGPLFWLVLLAIVPKWYALGRHYGDRAPTFRTVLTRAIRDGLRRDTSLSLAEVKQLAGGRGHPAA